MAKQIKVVAEFEGYDDEYNEALAEEQADIGVWTMKDGMAVCELNVMTLNGLLKLFADFGDELSDDEVLEIEDLEVGDFMTFERGRGSTYEVTAV